MHLVVKALDGGFFTGAAQTLDLAVGPRIGRFGHVVLHAVFAANAVKAVPARQELVRLRHKLHPVARQHGIYLVGLFVEHAPQKLGRHNPFGLRVQLGKGHLADAVDGHKNALQAFGLYCFPSSVWTTQNRRAGSRWSSI